MSEVPLGALLAMTQGANLAGMLGEAFKELAQVPASPRGSARPPGHAA